jgi:hypothetical protein
MDKTGAAIPPIIFLQVLHMAYPQFAEKSEHGGGFAQQVNIFILIIQSTFFVFFCCWLMVQIPSKSRIETLLSVRWFTESIVG